MDLDPGLRALKSTVLLAQRLFQKIELRLLQGGKEKEEIPGLCLLPVIRRRLIAGFWCYQRHLNGLKIVSYKWVFDDC